MKKVAIDLTGLVFERWTVLRRYIKQPDDGIKSTSALWVCQCECGTEKLVSGKALREQTSKSCGCLRKELLTSKNAVGFKEIANTSRLADFLAKEHKVSANKVFRFLIQGATPEKAVAIVKGQMAERRY